MTGECTLPCNPMVNGPQTPTRAGAGAPKVLHLAAATPLSAYLDAIEGSKMAVAFRLGIWPARVQAIASGTKPPTLAEALKMQERLQIPVVAWAKVPCVRHAIDYNFDLKSWAASRRKSDRKRYRKVRPNAKNDKNPRLPDDAPFQPKNNWQELPLATELVW